MTFPLEPADPFVDDVSKLNAGTANNWRVYISRAMDAVLGGAYELLNDLVITGAGFVLDRLEMSGTNRVQLAERSIPRMCDVGMPLFDPTEWLIIAPGRYRNTVIGANIDFPLHVPHGATLTDVDIQVFAPSHGGSWPPTNRNRITIYRVSTTGPTGIVGPISDTSVQATYQTRHYLSSPANSIPVDRTNEVYFLRVSTESGTNALAGVEVFATPRVTYTTTAMDED